MRATNTFGNRNQRGQACKLLAFVVRKLTLIIIIQISAMPECRNIGYSIHRNRRGDGKPAGIYLNSYVEAIILLVCNFHNIVAPTWDRLIYCFFERVGFLSPCWQLVLLVCTIVYETCLNGDLLININESARTQRIVVEIDAVRLSFL